MNLNIGQKIIAIFGLLLLLMGASGYFQLDQLRELKEVNTTVISHDIKTLHDIQSLATNQDAMGTLRAQLMVQRLLVKVNLPGPEAADFEARYRQELAASRETLRTMVADIESYARQAVSAERGAAFQRMLGNLRKIGDNLNAVGTETETLFKLAAAGEMAKAVEQAAKVRVLRHEIDSEMKELGDLADSVITAGHARTEAAYGDIRQAFLTTFAGLVVASLFLAWLLQRSIVQPLRGFMSFVEGIGRGDLGGEATVGRNDELGLLGQNLNRMVAGLREVATQTRAATENLNAATTQIRASTQQQAAGVEEQLAAVQETSATLDEITQSGGQMARRAKEVAAAAEGAAQASHAGLHAAEDTTRAMDAIREQAESVAENIVVLSEKTQAIGEIIITVNDIAERSHLLALNAAIEAASAGEQGRSFAVVAAEIKNLADQAKEATSQVRTILGEIQRGINSSVMLTEEAVKRVAYGKEQTDTTQRTIHDMSDNIQISVQTFQQIVAATNQHQIGLEQVMQALQNIRQASKQTADSTRQLDGAAANLSALGQQLTQAVSRYQL